MGDHCERCQGGFLGNNSLDGQAVSCSSCPCPLRVPSNKSVHLTFYSDPLDPHCHHDRSLSLHRVLFKYTVQKYSLQSFMCLCVVLQRVVCRRMTGCSVCACRVMLDLTVKGKQPHIVWTCCQQYSTTNEAIKVPLKVVLDTMSVEAHFALWKYFDFISDIL